MRGERESARAEEKHTRARIDLCARGDGAGEGGSRRRRRRRIVTSLGHPLSI